MKKEKIKSEELKCLITVESNKNEYSEVTDSDIENIKELTINKYLFNGQESKIELDEIRIFSNLIRLRIVNFEIDDAELMIINEFSKLYKLEFVQCLFKKNELNLSMGIKQLYFYDCELNELKIPTIEKIEIFKSNVNFRKIDFSKLSIILIQNSIIRNAYSLNKFRKIKNVNLDGSLLYDECNNEIKNISVGRETTYSHKNDVFYYNV